MTRRLGVPHHWSITSHFIFIFKTNLVQPPYFLVCNVSGEMKLNDASFGQSQLLCKWWCNNTNPHESSQPSGRYNTIETIDLDQRDAILVFLIHKSMGIKMRLLSKIDWCLWNWHFLHGNINGTQGTKQTWPQCDNSIFTFFFLLDFDLETLCPPVFESPCAWNELSEELLFNEAFSAAPPAPVDDKKGDTILLLGEVGEEVGDWRGVDAGEGLVDLLRKGPGEGRLLEQRGADVLVRRSQGDACMSLRARKASSTIYRIRKYNKSECTFAFFSLMTEHNKIHFH